MSRRKIDFPLEDQPLRNDVSLLRSLTEQVIRQQCGDRLLELVESAQAAAMNRQCNVQNPESVGTDPSPGSGPSQDDALASLLKDQSTHTAELLARAFQIGFQTTDVAERAHRIRRGLNGAQDDKASKPSASKPSASQPSASKSSASQPGSFQSDARQPGTWLDTCQRLKDGGTSLGSMLESLSSLVFEPVFTAHPTAATRRTLLDKELRIAQALIERLAADSQDDSRRTRQDRRLSNRIRDEIAAIWQTEPRPTLRPTVRDEREHVLYHLTDSIYAALPAMIEDLQHALQTVYGLSDDELYRLEIPNLLRCGSWVGGDMDGNPYVTAETLKSSLHRHREVILGLYADEIERLGTRLSHSDSRVDLGPELQERIRAYEALLPDVSEGTPSNHRGMPYRKLLRFMRRRVEITLEEISHQDVPSAGAYADAEELAGDLSLIRQSLDHREGPQAGAYALQRLQIRLQAFGFHLASLDQRQDSALHREVVGHLMLDDRWAERPAKSRLRRLRQLIPSAKPRAAPPGSPATVHQALAVFRALAAARHQGIADQAFGPYIISMVEGPDDVLSVLLLARWGGLLDGGSVPLDLVPLFETVDDLTAAPDIFRELLALPLYRQHLERRGGRQIVMIDYSDANKDGGLFASRWALRQAQIALIELVKEHPGIELVFFNGRGGTLSRGHQKTRQAVLNAAPGTFSGRLRMTEQGEMISDRYSLRGVAARTLEEVLSAGLERALSGSDRHPPVAEPWQQLARTTAETAHQTYRALIFEERKLYRYFRLATPIDVIERLMIGSRPSSRRTRVGVANLRAMPWILAWTQSRHVLPGWYGLGSGLQKAVETHGREMVVDAIKTWPLLSTMLSDAEMSLAKADMGIALCFSQLAGDLGETIFPQIRTEFDRTVEQILDLKDYDQLLADDPLLRRSIDLRTANNDAMSFLQIDLLKRWRDSGREDEDILKALITSVHGLTQGLKNTS